MTWAAVGVAGISLVSGMMGSSSAKKAANAQAGAAREATALQREMYNTNRADLAGYRQIGETATGQMNRDLPDMTRSFSAADFVKDPGYDFRMAEGQKALERSAAARGGLMGGAAGKALSRYGQDYASNEYQNAYGRFNNDRDQRFNKLSGLMTMGQNSAVQTGAAGQNYANQAGANMTGAGNAAAAGAIASGNAWSGAMNGAIGAIGMYNPQQKPTNSTFGDLNSQPINLSEMIKRSGQTA